MIGHLDLGVVFRIEIEDWGSKLGIGIRYQDGDWAFGIMIVD